MWSINDARKVVSPGTDLIATLMIPRYALAIMVEFFAAAIYIDGPVRQKLCTGSRLNYVNWPGAGLPSGQKGVVEVTGNAVGAVRLAARCRRAR